MTSDPKGVLLLATMDTKGPEALYVRSRIKEHGEDPILMDLSTRGERRRSEADITPADVARAGGSGLKQFASSRNRELNMEDPEFAAAVFGVAVEMFSEMRGRGSASSRSKQ
jgi:uncharacterized protein (UPF0261 family)